MYDTGERPAMMEESMVGMVLFSNSSRTSSKVGSSVGTGIGMLGSVGSFAGSVEGSVSSPEGFSGVVASVGNGIVGSVGSVGRSVGSVPSSEGPSGVVSVGSGMLNALPEIIRSSKDKGTGFVE